jgi:hypothetical protein
MALGEAEYVVEWCVPFGGEPRVVAMSTPLGVLAVARLVVSDRCHVAACRVMADVSRLVNGGE